MLADGSMHLIEPDTIVNLAVDCAFTDRQELANMGAVAVRNVVKKIGIVSFGGQSRKYRCCDSMIGNESMLGLRMGKK